MDENVNENKDFEFLEKLIKSNKENAEMGILLKNSNEDATRIMGKLMMDLEVNTNFHREMFQLYEVENQKREFFLNQIPKEFITVLSEETQKSMDNFKNWLQKGKKIFYAMLGVLFFSLLILFFAGNLALKWYSESIKTKTEIRAEVLEEIDNNGKIIYNQNELKALKENTKLMQIWIKNNPKKAEDFLRFKEGYDARAGK